jgi:phosphoserine phosphatase
MKIAFDVDGTLIVRGSYSGSRDVPNYSVIDVFRWFLVQGHDMIIWSGGGTEYANAWSEKLGLPARIIAKGSENVDIAFDDCDVSLATINIKIK